MAGSEGKVCKLCRYAQGMCQIGFRQSHERTDPQCRLHGVTGRASGAKSAPKPPGQPSPGGRHACRDLYYDAPLRESPLSNMGGLHLQYDPEPSIDQWINSQVLFDSRKGKYLKPTGEVVSTTRPKKGPMNTSGADILLVAVADKLTRITDKCLPLVANESRVFIMRFPEKVSKLLKRARMIRRRIKATKQGDTKVAVQPPKGERERGM